LPVVGNPLRLLIPFGLSLAVVPRYFGTMCL